MSQDSKMPWKKLDKSFELFVPGSVGERSTASSCSTWRNIVQRCACASKIPTAIAITAASSRAKPWATPTASIQPRPRPPLSATPAPWQAFCFCLSLCWNVLLWKTILTCPLPAPGSRKKRVMWNRIAAFSHLPCARAKQIKKSRVSLMLSPLFSQRFWLASLHQLRMCF